MWASCSRGQLFSWRMSEGDIMFAYVDGVAYEEMWRVTNHYGDVFEVDEPSVDRLVPGVSGRLPVVYPVLV